MDTNSPRYLFVCPFFPPPFIGGSKVWSYNMVSGCGKNIDVLTAELPEGAHEIVAEKVTTIRLKGIYNSTPESSPSIVTLFMSYATVLLWVLLNARRRRYHVIIAGAFDFCNGWLFLIGRIIGIPVIGLGNAEEFTLAKYSSSLRYKCKSLWIRFTHPKARAFVVVCDYCVDLLENFGVCRSIISVVPSSISPTKVPAKIEKNEKRGANVLSVGRLVKRKGFYRLVYAVAQIVEAIPDIRLDIVGNGPEFDGLEHLVDKLDLRQHVFIHSDLSDEQLASLYRHADVFALPHAMEENGDTEGCPTVFSEAGSWGVPSIGGNDAGSCTVIRHGETGFLVDGKNIEEVAAYLRRLLSDKRLARRMGLSAREKVMTEHTPEATGLKLAKILERFDKIEGI